MERGMWQGLFQHLGQHDQAHGMESSAHSMGYQVQLEVPRVHTLEHPHLREHLVV